MATVLVKASSQSLFAVISKQQETNEKMLQDCTGPSGLCSLSPRPLGKHIHLTYKQSTLHISYLSKRQF